MVRTGESRREFVFTMMALAAGSAGSTRRAGGAQRYPVRLGGPVFEGRGDPEALALAHVRLGYRAAYCPGVSPRESDRIAAISAAFRKHDVIIAEVGRWVNLLDASPEKRKQNLEQVVEGLALADEIGALCCVDIAGSYNAERWDGPHPDNLSDRFLDAAVENARRIIDAVKPKRAKFAYEMMPYALPDGPDSAVALVKAVSRPAFGIHLDPCNLINTPSRLYRNGELIGECFDKLGRWIVSCHAKDIGWGTEFPVHIREVLPGTGVLDYRTYLSRLSTLPHQPPLMIEHLKGPDEYDKARRFIQGLQYQ